MNIKLQTNLLMLAYFKCRNTLVLFTRQSGHNKLHMKWKFIVSTLPSQEGRVGRESREGSLRVVSL